MPSVKTPMKFNTLFDKGRFQANILRGPNFGGANSFNPYTDIILGRGGGLEILSLHTLSHFADPTLTQLTAGVANTHHEVTYFVI